ncbi:DUF3237 domain-containing protein [Salinibacterium sp. SYSU T00001]|uniref:DUF3237 domain-containing protein n=1 Tax=Homoserinimonas sedimenticola TaxID=2986805 RepID=UPI0022367E68|nr:DUF3237 domain-containing protein [Salinibacterium sedimenticola]MCW4384375.1 DUF3237 domain-containing protein [Salinibacterium sedimenticola]
MITPQTPELRFLADIAVAVGEPIEIGETLGGRRRIIPILGGRVEGPELNGAVLPAGADYQVLRSESVTELQAEYAIETDEGERVAISNFGIRSGSPEDIAALVRGERVDPGRIYFRCTPRMYSAGPRWSYLSSRILLGAGVRTPDEVLLRVFVVD